MGYDPAGGISPQENKIEVDGASNPAGVQQTTVDQLIESSDQEFRRGGEKYKGLVDEYPQGGLASEKARYRTVQACA